MRNNLKTTVRLFLYLLDAHKVHLKIDDYSEYDVANVLKRFFRNLPEPVMTKALYSKWIAMGGITK